MFLRQALEDRLSLGVLPRDGARFLDVVFSLDPERGLERLLPLLSLRLVDDREWRKSEPPPWSPGDGERACREACCCCCGGFRRFTGGRYLLVQDLAAVGWVLRTGCTVGGTHAVPLSRGVYIPYTPALWGGADTHPPYDQSRCICSNKELFFCRGSTELEYRCS